MHHNRYETIEDLVFNASFRSWVLEKDPAAAAFWEQWLGEDPARHTLAEDAKAIVLAMQTPQQRLPDHELQAELQRIREAAAGMPLQRRRLVGLPAWIRRTGAAAAVLLAAWLLVKQARLREHAAPLAVSGNIEKLNKGNTDLQLLLPDGSHVTLRPDSRIVYNERQFADSVREVSLEGDAFFDVMKDPAKPFLVLAKQTVTKVLGTSFRIRALPEDNRLYVTVTTGKVSVFKQTNYKEAAATKPQVAGLVLTPNQEVVFDQQTNELAKTITEKPVMTQDKPVDFTFDATPVKQVFSALEAAYSIPIVYDEELLSSCSITAAFGNESFFEKLTIICKSINATYEIVDGNVIISGRKCK